MGKREFVPETFVYALDRRVLVVAQTRVEGQWAAYCGAVPGIRHEDEKHIVLSSGNKLREREARFFFPDIDLPYAR